MAGDDRDEGASIDGGVGDMVLPVEWLGWCSGVALWLVVIMPNGGSGDDGIGADVLVLVVVVTMWCCR